MSDCETIQPLYQAGDRLGPFEIQRLLGSGSFADVYVARNVHLDQQAALKVIRRSESEEREREGARMMCRLQHPNIVAVRFADRIDGRLVIAMDYVDGETLAAEMRSAVPLELPYAIGIATAICQALDYVHNECGMAHLDLKPSNLLIDRAGIVHITDFGIAQWLRHEISGGAITGGSPAYMAPEQFEGRPCAQSDLWAVGILLHQMLTGEALYRRSTLEDYREAICARPPSWGSRFLDLPEALQQVVQSCLERDLARRFHSAGELGAKLSGVPSASGRKCAVCGSSMPAGGDVCPECTLANSRSARSRKRWQSHRVTERRKSVLVTLALALLLGALVFGGYRISVGMAFTSARSVAAGESWGRILRLEASQEGSYEDRLKALKTFASLYPDRKEAREAARKLNLWEEDYRLFSAADQMEKEPGAKISAALAQWTAFLDQCKTGFRRSYGENRTEFWKNELRQYAGHAELNVVSATGLPPFDSRLFGHLRPDPYFIVQQSGKEMYRSRLLKNDPSPVWNERTRVLIRPDLDLTLEIRDNRIVGSGLLLRHNLVPLPPDGRFRVAEGSIEVVLEIQRER
jgi:hypothetical protein